MFRATYNESSDETVLFWDNSDVGRVDGCPTHAQNGYLVEPDIRPIIQNAIQSAGTPERIDMLTSLIIYGVDIDWPNGQS